MSKKWNTMLVFNQYCIPESLKKNENQFFRKLKVSIIYLVKTWIVIHKDFYEEKGFLHLWICIISTKS